MERAYGKPEMRVW